MNTETKNTSSQDIGSNMTVPEDNILHKIQIIRGHKVMLDLDLAALYSVETKQLKRSLRRNIQRFPEDFMFQVTSEEQQNLRRQFGASRTQIIFQSINPLIGKNEENGTASLGRSNLFQQMKPILWKFCTLVIMIRRIYIDTSVFGGYFDKEFENEAKPFFQKILENRIKVIVSEILELELYRAPHYIHDFFESIPDELAERVELTDEARILSEKYILAKVVGRSSRADCQHIALATINTADVLASWNFKHIVTANFMKNC